MTPQHEKELFDTLCRLPRLREWFDEQLSTQLRILVSNNDVEQLRKAQGHAQLCEKFIARLDAAKKAATPQ